jgi:hypothetical protein
VANALARGIPRRDLKEEIWWWLGLFRWEFPLPEREEVAAEVGRILEFLQAHGAGLDGDDASIPLIRDLASLLENFREAYWITTRTAAQLDGEVVSEAAFQQRLRRYFDAAMLLGEVLKPEAATPVTFANAISRLVEVGCLERDTRAGEKGRWLRRGPAFGDLPVMAARIGGALVVPRGSRSSIDKPDALV